MNKNILISIVAAGVILTGCGGGGGGGTSSSSVSTKSISGKVVDPEIKDATVILECSNGNNYSAANLTNTNGEFTINNINSNENLENCTIVSRNGIDGADDLSGKTLKAPYKLYSNNTGLLITPLTTAVANHNEVNTNIEKAKDDIRKFFKLNEGDLVKNPIDDINIAKITKQVTKIAINSSKGFDLIDIDDEITSDDFTNFIDNEINDSVIPNSSTFKQELDKIKNYTSLEDMRKDGIVPKVYNFIKELYKITDDTNYKANLEYLSEEIMEAAKSEDIYILPTRYQVRKALYDLELTPAFKADDPATSELEDKTITDELNTKLVLDLNTFKTTYNKTKININTINGISILDSSTYKKIVGNNNDERIEYYIFSDKSHIAKAINLISNSYDDKLLNPSYVQIAAGFAKEGYYEEAKNVLKENIYGELEKIEANASIAYILRTHGKNSEAKELLDENFTLIKSYFTKKGFTNLDNNDSAVILDLFLSYYNIGKSVEGEKVIDYLQKDVAPSWNSTTTYGKLAVEYRNLIWKLIEENKVADAKYLFAKAADYVKNIPHTKDTQRSALSNIFFIAHLGPLLKENAKTTELINVAKAMDTQYSTNYIQMTRTNYSGSEKGYAAFAREYDIALALNGEKDKILKLIEDDKKIEKTTIYPGGIEFPGDVTEDVLSQGLIASMYIDSENKSSEEKAADRKKAMDLLYEHRPFKDYEGAPFNLGNQILRTYVPRTISGSLDTPRILKAYNKVVMSDFFEDLIKDMETRPWTLDDKALSKYVLNYKYGLPVVAKHYNDVNEIVKRDEIITKSVTMAKAMTDNIYKLDAYHAIIDVANDLKVESSSTITDLVTEIDSLVTNATLDNTASDYENKLRTAIKQVKNLAKYKSVNEAKSLATKTISSLPTRIDGNLDNIKSRISFAIGNISFKTNFKNDYDYYSNSILSALVELKEYAKAETLIDTISSDVATLGDSLDAYVQYIKVARAYAAINNVEKAKSTIAKIKTLKEKTNATYKTVQYLSTFDAFSNSSVASVDTDGDNKADFYTKTATAEQIAKSGIELDEDIDGDGVVDTVDELPYFKNSSN